MRKYLCKKNTISSISGPGPFPGLLDIWGGIKTLWESRAALVASHGFVTMVLKYFSRNKIEAEDVDLNFFEVGHFVLYISL